MVFVLNEEKIPQAIVTPKEARLLRGKGARFYKYYPPVIIAHDYICPEPKSYILKIDIGSKTTGIALVGDGFIDFAMQLSHRQDISKKMEKRSVVRRGRRNRKTRYRKARFNNRVRSPGWMGPSSLSPLENLKTWVLRLKRFANIRTIYIEDNKFDTQKLVKGNISGKEYQEGELLGHRDVRDYLLAQENRSCFYCDTTTSKKWEADHLKAKSNGGSNALYNRVLSCSTCNKAKGNSDAEEFLRVKYNGNKTELNKYLKRLKDKQDKWKELKSAAATNKLVRRFQKWLKSEGYSYEAFEANITAKNRKKFFPDYNKSIVNLHWIDASCIGPTESLSVRAKSVLIVGAIGYGNRHMQGIDCYGFPNKKARSRQKKFDGFQRGDIVKCKNKNHPNFVGRIIGSEMKGEHASCKVMGRDKGSKDEINKPSKFMSKNMEKIHAFDGYSYSFSSTKWT